MPTVRFLYRNVLSDGILSASNEDVGFPALNLLHPHRTRVARNTGITGEWWKVWFMQPTAISCVVVFHDFNSAGTFRFQAHSADVWDAPDLDIPLTYSKGAIVAFFDEAAYSFVRLVCTHPTGSYIEVANFIVGTFYEPSRNFLGGFDDALVDPSKVAYSLSGQPFSDKKKKFRRLGLSFKYINEAEWDGVLSDFFDDVGITKDFVLFMDYINYPSSKTFWGRFEGRLPGVKNIPGVVGQYRFSIKFRESL